MLDSLLIRNFRLFKKLRIERLGRVNLFVGQNNSGKSCLLEAIQVYAFPSKSVLFNLVEARDEDVQQSDSHLTQHIRTFENPLRHLFHGYSFPKKISNGIKIGSVDNADDHVTIDLCTFRQVEGEERREKLETQDTHSLRELYHKALESQFQIGLSVAKGKTSYIISSSDIERETSPLRFWSASYGELTVPQEIYGGLQTIPTTPLSSTSVTALWDRINLTDLESDVILGLQMIEPRVKGVALVGEKQNGRVPIVRLEGASERIPLKSLGAGMERLFHISLALVNAHGGFLLIDEFENGLHWTVQPKLWNMIFRVAEKLDVQVFATTHSQDCVRSFHGVWSKQEHKGSFHRLDPDPETGARCASYDAETLSDSLETDVEVR